MSNNKRMTIGDFLPPPTKPTTTANSIASSAPSTPQHQNQQPQVPTTPYTIRATKKGGVPCMVESRKHHKVVCLSNIEGDVGALLTALQKALGTGGVVKSQSVIEVQGEHHLEKIRAFCLKSGCVVGATKQSKAAVVEAAAAAAAATAKAKQKSKSNTDNATTKPAAAAAAAVISGTASLLPKEIKAMKPETLKKHLAARDLSIQGNKKELVARLIAS